VRWADGDGEGDGDMTVVMVPEAGAGAEQRSRTGRFETWLRGWIHDMMYFDCVE
jgi:hypothetical protein